MTPDTKLVSIMAVNNEVGTVQPIRELAAIAKKHGALFHTDAAQAAGRVPLDVYQDGIDLLSLSAHKIYGPKGVGALYVRGSSPKTPIARQMHGGAQERGVRAGTLNVPGIVGFGEAAKWARAESDEENQRLRAWRDELLGRLESEVGGVHLNGSRQHRVDCNLNLCFEGLAADRLLHSLSGVAVSGGAACSSGKAEGSHVLRAMGLDEVRVKGAIRLSLGRMTTQTEVDTAFEQLSSLVNLLRRRS